MRLVRTFGPRGRFAVAAVVAAISGSGAAAAIPALASSSTTVTVLTLPQSGTIGVVSIVPAPSGLNADWLVTGENTYVDQLDANSAISTPAFSGTAVAFTASGPVSVNDGSTVYVDDGDNLLALTASGGAITSSTVVATPSIRQQAITVGPDGRIFIANDSGSILGCSVAGAPVCASYAVPSAFAGGGSAGKPQGLVSAGGALWFTDANGDLGAMSATGQFSPAYDAGDFVIGPGVITSTGDDLWLVSKAKPDVIDEVAVSATAPTATTTYTVTYPASPGITTTTPSITSLATGPDGNIWFTDTANEAVGFVSPSARTDSEYPVPSGSTDDALDGTIAAGPVGTDTLVFPLRTESGGSLAVNLLGQITSPDPSTMSTPTTTTSSTPSTPSTPTSTPSTPTSTPSTPSTPSTSTPSPVTPTLPPATSPAVTPTTTYTPVAVGKETVGVAETAAVSGKRVALLKVSCAKVPTTCAGKLTLTVTVATKVKEKVKGKLKTVTKMTTLTLAGATFSLRAGRAATVKLKLSTAGYTRLESARGEKLKVIATFTGKPGYLSTTVTLAGPKPKVNKK